MSDEAHFHFSGYVNKQNCRIWAQQQPKHFVEKPLHSQKVTVWCGVMADEIIGPYFFENDVGNAVTVTGERYRNIISTFLEPQLEARHLRNIWYQQDGATNHTARETIILLNRLFPQKLISQRGDANWPPRSPDLTIHDFYLWGYLKGKVYINEPTTIAQLKRNI
ncbi:hypothetical protein FHG87_011770 [Trinorchestia longiramus]|nr:hypothetical protein FHG87_011770 [Trinorchestia longiramus]